MEKLIMYKNYFFFLRPVNLDMYDTEFEIYDLGGTNIGSTVWGIKNGTKLFSSETEKDDFMEWLQIEAHKIEAMLKFALEFNCPVENADQLDLSTDKIVQIMKTKWSIPPEIMDAVLP
ncbi:hypothetical protein [Paenibacillus hamazuiensis]|uniref:hypothetical protein n=1 Tax=Paenibacillus hamazuiensis TaxID=2936508 RepID=UPI00200CD323|nr:hypothetical protein [Paenibacillus hamazuiensis]